MYKIAATIIKNGQSPVIWSRFTDKKVNKTEAAKMFIGSDKVVIEDFKCEKVK